MKKPSPTSRRPAPKKSSTSKPSPRVETPKRAKLSALKRKSKREEDRRRKDVLRPALYPKKPPTQYARASAIATVRNFKTRVHYTLAALVSEIVLSRRLKLCGELRDIFECVDRERWAALEEGSTFRGVEDGAAPLREEIDTLGWFLRNAVNEPTVKGREKLCEPIREILFAVERKRLAAIAWRDEGDPWAREALIKAALEQMGEGSEEEEIDAFDPVFGGQGWD